MRESTRYHSKPRYRRARESFGLVTILCVTFLTGCGESNPGPQSTAEPAAPPLESLDEAKDEPTATLIEAEDGSIRVVKEDEATGAATPAE